MTVVDDSAFTWVAKQGRVCMRQHYSAHVAHNIVSWGGVNIAISYIMSTYITHIIATGTIQYRRTSADLDIAIGLRMFGLHIFTEFLTSHL